VSPTFKYQNLDSLLKDHHSFYEAFVTDGSIDDVVARSVNAIFGLDAHVFGGFASDRWVAYGFENGEVPFAVASLSAFLPLIEAGKAEPILLSNPVPKGTVSDPAGKRLADTPTIASIASQVHLSAEKTAALAELSLITGPLSGLAVAVPVGVPSNRATALATALGQAMATTHSAHVITGSVAQHLFTEAVQDESALISYVRT
jgi:hypothetical protein